jgi:hypothetical protein
MYYHKEFAPRSTALPTVSTPPVGTRPLSRQPGAARAWPTPRRAFLLDGRLNQQSLSSIFQFRQN